MHSHDHEKPNWSRPGDWGAVENTGSWWGFQMDTVEELGTARSFIFPCVEESMTEENSGSCPIFRKAALETELERKQINDICALFLNT